MKIQKDKYITKVFRQAINRLKPILVDFVEITSKIRKKGGEKRRERRK